jgi:opacity protein-like surface antigen
LPFDQIRKPTQLRSGVPDTVALQQAGFPCDAARNALSIAGLRVPLQSNFVKGEFITLYARSLAVFLAATGTAQAGGPTIVAADPVPATAAPAPLRDWSGPYVGLSYGKTSADITFNTGNNFDFEDGDIVGLHAGYLFQRGALVYGGEIAYGSLSDTFIALPTCCEITHSLDLKGRVGYATNRVLFYGVLGYSMFEYVEYAGGIETLDMDLDGFAYGLGAEYAVSDRLTLGLEYMARDGSGDAAEDASITADSSLDTISLRVGLSF